MKKTWIVTRQRQWPDGDLVVEISYGGYDYTNPGQLVRKYDGECEEFADPREAVETGIRVAQAWQNDTAEEVCIGRGFTMGCTLPFDGDPLTEETFREYREWAAAEAEQLPKCDHCGGIIESAWVLPERDEEFCSENCADLAWEYMQEDEEDAEPEEEPEVPALSGFGVHVTRIATSQVGRTPA